MKLLSTTLANKRQGVQLERFYEFEGHKVRTTVYVDSYDVQCFARAERWNGERWYEIVTLPYSAMHSTKAASMYHKTVDNERDLNIDTRTLIGRVKDVLT